MGIYRYARLGSLGYGAIRYAAVPVGFVFDIILPIILTDPEGALSILSAVVVCSLGRQDTITVLLVVFGIVGFSRHNKI